LASYAAVAALLGGIVALVGGGERLDSVRNWLLVGGGVYMVLLGLSMTGRLAPLRRLVPSPPQALVSAVSRTKHHAKGDEAEGRTGLAAPVVLGALTGFMPCAPLIAAQTAAAGSGSPLTAMSLMIAFGLGTVPLMLAFGLGASLVTGVLKRRIQIVSAIAVVLFGLVILDRGLVLVKSPITFATVATTVSRVISPQSSVGFATGADGVVEVPLVIRDTEYVPHDVVIPAGRAVRLVVDRQEDVRCSDQLQIPAIGLLVDLAPNGVTRVDVPAMRPGTYNLTCGMAMMSGSLVVVTEDEQ
jgi:sulfite exporter TauE/SafE